MYFSLSCRLDPFEAFIIFSIRHEIRRIDLHKRDYSLLVPGLRNTIALDFHFSRSLLYWTDVVEDKIYRGKLSESGGMQPAGHMHVQMFAMHVKGGGAKLCCLRSSRSRWCEHQKWKTEAVGDEAALCSSVFTFTRL